MPVMPPGAATAGTPQSASTDAASVLRTPPQAATTEPTGPARLPEPAPPLGADPSVRPAGSREPPAGTDAPPSPPPMPPAGSGPAMPGDLPPVTVATLQTGPVPPRQDVASPLGLEAWSPAVVAVGAPGKVASNAPGVLNQGVPAVPLQAGARLVASAPATPVHVAATGTGLADGVPVLSRAETAAFLFGPADAATGRPAPWASLGLSPQAWGAAVSDRPWEVASAQLGMPGAVDAAGFARLEALPGPLGALLRAGAEPRAALAVQDAWLGLVAPGGAASAWGLDRAAPALRDMVPALPPGTDAARLRATAQQLLGTQPAVPPAGLDQGLVLALGGSALLPLMPGQVPPPGWAALAVPSAGEPPVLLMAEAARLPDTLPSLPVAPGVTLRRDALSGALVVLADSTGPLGTLAGPVAAALAEQLARLDLPDLPRGLALQVALSATAEGGMVFGGLAGTALSPDGAVRAFGAPPRAEDADRPATTTPAWVGSTAILHLRAGASAGSDPRAAALGERYVEYVHPVPVPLDLAPGPGAAPLPADTARLWRMDDTRAFVGLEGTDTQAALAEAAALHRNAVQGRLTPAELRPGTGVSTWDGSILSLAWAGIRKGAGAGVGSADAAAPRVELLRAAENLGSGWLATRPGDGRQVVAPRPDEGLRLFLAYGLDPTAAAGGPAPAGAVDLATAARDGFAAALLEMERVKLAWWLPPAETARRQEAWAAIARDWAAALTDLAGSGAPLPLYASRPPERQASDLNGVAQRFGGAAAWHAAISAGLDLAAVLAAAGPLADPLSAALAPSAMRAAAALGLPADTAQAGAAVAPVADLVGSRIAFVTTAASVMLGREDLAALALDLARYGAAALRGATEGAALGRGDDAALAARLGRGAVTDVDRGYLSPFLRLGRIGGDDRTQDGGRAQEDERPERRARVG